MPDPEDPNPPPGTVSWRSYVDAAVEALEKFLLAKIDENASKTDEARTAAKEALVDARRDLERRLNDIEKSDEGRDGDINWLRTEVNLLKSASSVQSGRAGGVQWVIELVKFLVIIAGFVLTYFVLKK